MNIDFEKRYFIDRLRVIAISLVVAHHSGQAYGPTGGSWPVFENSRSDLLSPFFGVNAGFGMALFFLIAGYFVPVSLERNGKFKFLIKRLVRLGIPTILFGFLIFPLIGYSETHNSVPFFDYYFSNYLGKGNIQYGHLWFVFHLFIYSIFFVSLSETGIINRAFGKFPSLNQYLLFATVAIIAISSGLINIIYPQDRWINVLGFFPVEPYHLPQYLLMFFVGCIAGQNSWFEKVSVQLVNRWLGIGLFCAIFWYLIRYLQLYAQIEIINSNLLSFLYPFWEAFLCVGLSIGIFGVVYRKWNEFNSGWNKLAKATMGVYIIHVFIVVGLNHLLLDVSLFPFFKFILVTLFTIPLCFILIIGFQISVAKLIKN